MPEAVILTVRCLEAGCDLGDQQSSVGLCMDDAERMQTAEAFVDFAAKWHRQRHAAGVECRFSDDPGRRLVFSKAGGQWSAAKETNDNGRS